MVGRGSRTIENFLATDSRLSRFSVFKADSRAEPFLSCGLVERGE